MCPDRGKRHKGKTHCNQADAEAWIYVPPSFRAHGYILYVYICVGSPHCPSRKNVENERRTVSTSLRWPCVGEPRSQIRVTNAGPTSFPDNLLRMGGIKKRRGEIQAGDGKSSSGSGGTDAGIDRHEMGSALRRARPWLLLQLDLGLHSSSWKRDAWDTPLIALEARDTPGYRELIRKLAIRGIRARRLYLIDWIAWALN